MTIKMLSILKIARIEAKGERESDMESTRRSSVVTPSVENATSMLEVETKEIWHFFSISQVISILGVE